MTTTKKAAPKRKTTTRKTNTRKAPVKKAPVKEEPIIEEEITEEDGSEEISEDEEKKGKGGRPRTYWNPTDLKKKIDEYISECDRDGIFPDEAGMFLYLGIYQENYDFLISDDNPNQSRNLRIFEYARLCRKSRLMRTMVKDPKAANGCMNALKQIENGGLTDRPTENQDRKIHIKVAESDEELFK